MSVAFEPERREDWFLDSDELGGGFVRLLVDTKLIFPYVWYG
jgi:hypothetical protein